MLVLSRKTNQKIHINDNVTITILESKTNKVKLGIDAPPEVGVVRGELRQEQQAKKAAAGQNRRILIIDDNADDRLMVRRYMSRLTQQQFTFSESELGKEGLQRCRDEMPDCIVLDYRLPDLNGLEFLNELRRDRIARHIPVIVLTGEGNEAVAMQATLSGAQIYLCKNRISAEILQQAVHKVMDLFSVN